MSVSLSLIVPVKKSVTDKPIEVIEKSVKMLLPDIQTNIGLTICDNDYIETLNAKYREKHSATDVLSFPLLVSGSPGRVSYSTLDMDPETNELLLGDIIISIEMAKYQAQDYGHSLERELCYLSVHSVLHIFGYDHMCEADKKIMREKEEEILNSLGIGR